MMQCHCEEIEVLHERLARLEKLLDSWREGPPTLMSGLTAAGKVTRALEGAS